MRLRMSLDMLAMLDSLKMVSGKGIWAASTSQMDVYLPVNGKKI